MTPQHPDFERWSQDKQEAYAEQRRAWREENVFIPELTQLDAEDAPRAAQSFDGGVND